MYMSKRKRGKEKLKEKFRSILPNKISSERRNHQERINVSTNKNSENSISTNLNKSNFELKSRNYHQDIKGPWFINHSQLSYSPLRFKEKKGTIENKYYCSSKSSLKPMLNANYNINNSYDTFKNPFSLPDSLMKIKHSSCQTYDNIRIIDKTRNSEVFQSSYACKTNNSNLSSFTRVRNYLAKNDIEKYNKSASESYNQELLKEKDSAKNLLQSATRELRCLAYKLSTVVSDGNYHQILEPSTPTNVEIIK